MGLFSKSILFICSYYPLFILIILNTLDESRYFILANQLYSRRVVMLFTVIILLITFYFAFKLSKEFLINKTVKRNQLSYKYFVGIKPIKNDVLTNYVVTLFIPLIAINITSSIDLVIISILVIIIFVIFMQGNLIYINPLIFLRYNAYECRVSEDEKLLDHANIIIITKNPLSKFIKGSNLKMYRISESIYFVPEI